MKKGKILIIALVILCACSGIGALVLLNVTGPNYSEQTIKVEQDVTEMEDGESISVSKSDIDIDSELQDRIEPEEENKENSLLRDTQSSIETDEKEPEEDDPYKMLVDDYTAYYNGTKTYDQTLVNSMIGEDSSVMNYGSYDHPWLCDQEYFTGSDCSESGISLEAAFYDINNDGTEEMFIVERYSDFVMIHDVWTVVDEQLKMVGYWDARFDLVVSDDYKLYEIASGGWNSAMLCEMELGNNGEMTIKDEVDMIPGEGDATYYQHNGQDISEEEFNSLAEQYYSLSKNSMTNMKNIVIAGW